MDSSVRTLETQMKEGFEAEGTRRKEDYKNLEEKMVSRREESFKKEQHARQLARSEMAQGFKNAENARPLVQKEPAVMKDEIKN